MKTQLALPNPTSPDIEVDRIKVVRGAVGPEVQLMCDINQRWSAYEAIAIGHRLEEYALHWLEDVTTADDYTSLAKITGALKTPVAGGEYLYGIAPFRQMLEAGSVDIPMIDLVRVGGITQWVKVGAWRRPLIARSSRIDPGGSRALHRCGAERRDCRIHALDASTFRQSAIARAGSYDCA